MGLESTMICLDNSEWMRNGDYVPSRLEAQNDAASLLCGSKIQSNPESTVGVLTMAGKGVEVLVSPTDDMGKLLGAFRKIHIGGQCLFANAIQVAQLSLKHRENKKGSQRIIVFTASPIVEDEKAMTKLGKVLKKNNVAVDVVSFGDIDSNQSKIQAFVDAVNSNSNSHIVIVPVGALPSDVLVSSPIVHGGESGGGGGGGGSVASGEGGFAEYGGVDPSMDPELALALRVSMEEERARQEATSKQSGGDSVEAQASENTSMPMQQEAWDEDESMKLALQLSMDPTLNSLERSKEGNEESKHALNDDAEADAASSSSSSLSCSPPPPAPAPAAPAAFLDPTFVNSLLSGLPGVDPNDPKIQAAMAQIRNKTTNTTTNTSSSSSSPKARSESKDVGKKEEGKK